MSSLAAFLAGFAVGAALIGAAVGFVLTAPLVVRWLFT